MQRVSAISNREVSLNSINEGTKMRALVWHGKEDIRCETVADPKIEQPRDAILKVASCAICGSDLHLYDHFMLGMQKGDVIGHEFMGTSSKSARGWTAV